VYHLLADGRIDPAFGDGGTWLRPGTESGGASGFAVGPDGSVAVSIAVHGPKPWTETWVLNDVPPTLASRDSPEEAADEDDLRTEWNGSRWVANSNGGPTQVVPASATLAHRAAAVTPAVAPASTD